MNRQALGRRLRPVEAFLALEAAWQECLRLAWKAYSAGTIPVGAVLADSAGKIVSRGSNEQRRELT